MKKIFSILMVFTLIFSFAACSNNITNEESSSSPQQSSAPDLIQKLKAELGDRYSFEKLYDEDEIRQMQKIYPPDFPETTAAALTAGCLKIDAVLYRAGGSLLLGYDVFVKDDPDSEEWICYDNPTDP